MNKFIRNNRGQLGDIESYPKMKLSKVEMEELQENMLEKLSTGAGQRLVRESIGRNAEFKRTIQGYYDQYQKDKCEAGHDKKLNSRK